MLPNVSRHRQSPSLLTFTENSIDYSNGHEEGGLETHHLDKREAENNHTVVPPIEVRVHLDLFFKVAKIR